LHAFKFCHCPNQNRPLWLKTGQYQRRCLEAPKASAAPPTLSHRPLSGLHFVPAPSPSLDPRAIENIEPKDRIRHEAAKALETARSCAEVACKTAREIHVDPMLDLPTRHRKAHDQSFKLIAPALAPLETALAKNAKACEELRKIVAGPTIELSDAAAIEIRSRLAGLPKDQRMAAIARSIAKGSDAVVATLLGGGVRCRASALAKAPPARALGR
jgi:hypothetical protein